MGKTMIILLSVSPHHPIHLLINYSSLEGRETLEISSLQSLNSQGRRMRLQAIILDKQYF